MEEEWKILIKAMAIGLFVWIILKTLRGVF